MTKPESHDPMDREPMDFVDRATAALRGAAVTDEPSPRLMATTVESLQHSSLIPVVSPGRHERKRFVFRIHRFGRATATLIVLAVLVMAGVFVDRGAAVTFANMLEKVEKARAVRFVCKQDLAGAPGPETKMSVQGDRVRYEIPRVMVVILDTSERKGIELHPGRKVAKEIDLVGRVPAEDLKDPIDQLRNLKDQKDVRVEQLSDETVGDVPCQVYRVTGAKALQLQGEWKVWVDAKKALPVKMQIGDETTSMTFEQFVWDKPQDAALFEIKVPEGYVSEEPLPAKVLAGRIYYHKWSDFHSLTPEGKEPQRQFLPRNEHGGFYVPELAELSSDGRYLVIGYTKGGSPPERALIWDRTQPKEAAVEVYARPGAEVQNHCHWSPDGRRLYFAWWEPIPGTKGPHGRTGADVVDVKSKVKQPLKLPSFTDADGREKPMQFAAPSSDGQTYLVVGQGLHVATAAGKLVRRLTPADEPVGPGSVRLSPDGRHAVYVTFHQGSQRLCVVPLAGGEPKVLVASGKFTDLRARWSPDGKRIAYTCRLFDRDHPRYHGGEAYLTLVKPDGTDAVRLLSEKVHPNEVSWDLTAWH
jgi:hypothetical protein